MPAQMGGGAALLAILSAFTVWCFFSPQFTDVGYRPHQPVPFSHKLHAGELAIDCRYCHAMAEFSALASIPPTQTCMNCHHLAARKSEKLQMVRDSLESGEPIQWVRVHKIPEYAYFNHSLHLRAGVGCSSCHGEVAQMDEIRQVEPLSMSWCLDCHRQPEGHLRPLGRITQIDWDPSESSRVPNQVQPSTDCSACHR